MAPDAAGAGRGAGLLGCEPTRHHARMRPDRIACIELATGTTLTFRDLDQRVGACAAGLAARGPVGERLAYLGRNSIDLVVLALACDRAGWIFVPLNWRLTGAELRPLVADASPVLLVHDPEFTQAAASAGIPRVERSQVAILRAAGPMLEPRHLDPDAPCALLYTSGTTGPPKGAVVTREGALFSALNFAGLGELSAGCVILSDAPMFHTIGLFATMRAAVTVGATLVISARFDPAQTLRALSRHRVTHYFGVPQMAASLLRDPGFAGADMSRLRAFFVGGAPVEAALVEAYLARRVLLVNGYGLSEACTVLHMPLDAAAIAARPGAIGHPAPFVDIRIVRPDGRDCGVDEVGEIRLRGPAVTLCYWRNPSATAAAFADGWYRTGDAARRDAGGCCWLVDRLSDFYISGGENVSPVEVERVLAAHAGVADVAVLGASHPRWGECGIAFVVPRPGMPPDPAAILAFCDGRLARFKHPAEIRLVDEIPRTASGKIQRHRLRAQLVV